MKPFAKFLQRCRLEMVDPTLARRFLSDQVRVSKCPQVFGNRWAAEVEQLGEF